MTNNSTESNKNPDSGFNNNMTTDTPRTDAFGNNLVKCYCPRCIVGVHDDIQLAAQYKKYAEWKERAEKASKAEQRIVDEDLDKADRFNDTDLSHGDLIAAFSDLLLDWSDDEDSVCSGSILSKLESILKGATVQSKAEDAVNELEAETSYQRELAEEWKTRAEKAEAEVERLKVINADMRNFLSKAIHNEGFNEEQALKFIYQ